jgi:hypothetical protein
MGGVLMLVVMFSRLLLYEVLEVLHFSLLMCCAFISTIKSCFTNDNKKNGFYVNPRRGGRYIVLVSVGWSMKAVAVAVARRARREERCLVAVAARCDCLLSFYSR